MDEVMKRKIGVLLLAEGSAARFERNLHRMRRENFTIASCTMVHRSDIEGSPAFTEVPDSLRTTRIHASKDL
ncbi:hypothetical protein ALO35_200060 [Pseudomonas amygdali pv. lachrymans]|uniref:ADP-ribosylglycohydrolase n=1 Tax=Pseudomonas amygdali pv. lachrymans TaxID=53707 RepID=A0A0N8RXQ1_PSEAV|nr:hypothetical protein ALO35_200060 [Pseudomonas amygdali pv. lachrymans]